MPDTACALQHSWRYGAAVAAMGREVQRAEIWRDGRLLGLAQILLRRAGPLRMGFVPRGPIWLDHGCLQGGTLAADCLRRLGRALPGVGTLIATPEGPGAPVLPLLTPMHMAELPLSATPEEMRARMHGKWRNRLVRSERGRLKLASTIPSGMELAWLTAQDQAQRLAHGYRALPPAFLAAWAGASGAPMRLYTARARGEIVAAMLFLDHAPGVTYHIGWNGEEGRRASAHHRLLWKAMRDFARLGRQRIDLGLLDTVNAPGLARFKLGAGAAVRELGATGLVLPGTPFSAWRDRRLLRNVGRRPPAME